MQRRSNAGGILVRGLLDWCPEKPGATISLSNLDQENTKATYLIRPKRLAITTDGAFRSMNAAAAAEVISVAGTTCPKTHEALGERTPGAVSAPSFNGLRIIALSALFLAVPFGAGSVQAQNPPVAAADTATTPEDTAVTVAVLRNDTDRDGDQLTVTSVTTPANGTAKVNSNFTVTYTPDADWNGTDTFDYVVSDGTASATATVTVTVSAVNDPPVAAADNVTTKDDVAVSVDVLANDTDADGDALSVTAVTKPAKGEAKVNSNYTVTYTPDANWNGTDTFDYVVSDGTALDTATVTVTVGAGNKPPVAVDDAARATKNGGAVTINVLANDKDGDGDALSVTLVAQPSNGSATVNAENMVKYTPDTDFSGRDPFDYVASDGTASDTATVMVTVGAVNDAPVAADDAATTTVGTAVTVDVLANDTDGDGDNLSVTSVTMPAHGTATVNANFTVTYAPDTGWTGTDTFDYVASDGTASDEATVTVTVTVSGVNERPVARDDVATTDEDTAVSIRVLANDTDPDGDRLAVKSVTRPSHGSVKADANGVITYTPEEGFAGKDSFDYTVTDGRLDARAKVRVTVRPVNDAPETNDDAAETDEDTPVEIAVLANDSDPENDELTAVLVTQPRRGTAAVNDGKTITYTPDQDFHGTDEFEYAASDGDRQTNATVTVTVRPVADPPVPEDDDAETDEDTAVEINVLANDADADGDRLTVTSVARPSHGGATANADGTVTYTPNEDFAGEDAFAYTVTDGTFEAEARVTVTVLPVNDPPEAANDTAETDEDTAVEIDVLGNDTDVDGDELSVQSATDPEHGTVTVNRDGAVTYEPDANYYGGDAFEYTISDGRATATAAVTVTVHPVNDAPVAEDDRAETTEDNAVAIPVLDNDSDPEESSLSVESVTRPGHGTAAANADGNITYTPGPNYFGDDAFRYTITDGEATAMATVSVRIYGVNDPPAATDPMPDMALIVGRSLGSVDAAGFFEDVDGDPLKFGAVSSEAGVASVSASGSALTVTAVSEGAATITVTASDGQASGTQTFSVTVRVDQRAEKQMMENVLAAMGRNMLTSVTTAIAGRFSGSGGGAGLTVAGRQMSLGDGSVLMALADLAGARRGPGKEREPMTGVELVRGSSFTLPLGQQSGGGRWALWGQGDLQSFEGVDYAGDLTTGYAGLDFRAGSRWVAGVSVSRGGGDMAYSVLGGRGRQMTTAMMGVYPYVRWASRQGTEIWTIAGMGRGDLENQRAGRLERSDLSMRMGVVGVRQSLTGSGALRFGVRGDIGYINLSTTDGAEVSDGLRADAMRIRLGFEGSYTAALGSSVALEPFAEAGAVRDGGDGETGDGLEVAGGLRLGGSRVHIEARGRMMAIHTAEDYSEQGFSVAAAVNAGEGGSGLSMSLAPRWGARTDGAETLWRDRDLREVVEGPSNARPGSLDAKIGYGLGVRDGESMLTPFGELNVSGSVSQRTRIGARLATPGSLGQALAMEFAAMRSQLPNEAPKYGLALRGSVKLR